MVLKYNFSWIKSEEFKSKIEVKWILMNLTGLKTLKIIYALREDPLKILNCLKLNWPRKTWKYVLGKWCQHMETVHKELILEIKVLTHGFEVSTHRDRGQSFENEWSGVDTWIRGVDTCDLRTKFEKLMIKSRHMKLKCQHMKTMDKN